MIGWPSGLAVQVPLGRSSAFNGSLYYDLRGPSFDVHLDHIFLASRPIFEHLYPYVGWGGYLTARSSSDDHDHAATHHHTQGRFDLSARLPVGVEVGRHNLRGFFELAPTLSVIPALQIRIGGSIGIRYHF